MKELLKRWIELLETSGEGTKRIVLEEMREEYAKENRQQM